MKKRHGPATRRMRSLAVHTGHRRFWFTAAVIAAAGAALTACALLHANGSTVHHIAIAVLAERVALGLGGGGGEGE